MTICECCGEEMTVDTCIANKFITYPDGEEWHSLAHHFSESSGRCHDCNIKHGGKHHPGCDVERCPRCKGQLITCGCRGKHEQKTANNE